MCVCCEPGCETCTCVLYGCTVRTHTITAQASAQPGSREGARYLPTVNQESTVPPSHSRTTHTSHPSPPPRARHSHPLGGRCVGSRLYTAYARLQYSRRLIGFQGHQAPTKVRANAPSLEFIVATDHRVCHVDATAVAQPERGSPAGRAPCCQVKQRRTPSRPVASPPWCG